MGMVAILINGPGVTEEKSYMANNASFFNLIFKNSIKIFREKPRLLAAMIFEAS